ncbi:MAG: 50S ribosomal protein L21 [Acidobacteria bacterium]|jgi:large subunit ribosomal protein L21|nr:50S ribosomal protein L21 [Acidobacteriota bacterium]
MYAIVKVGGKQHKVSAGDKLKVEKLGQEPGATVEWPALLVVDGDQIMVHGEGKEAMVTAKVLGDGQLKKVLVFHKKRRKQYKKIYGHRQPFTQVEILGISKD